MYFLKTCCVMPHSKNRGQIIGHVFALKCGALGLYPSYGEFVSYCYGFMMADLPWFNQQLGEAMGRRDDLLPYPHAMYYTNLSITSTFFLAMVSAGVAWLVAAVLGYVRPAFKQKCDSFKSFLYNFFVMGTAIAGCLSVEGALLNPIEAITLGSISYIVGILLYVGLFIEIVYSIATQRNADSLSSVGKQKRRELEKGMPDNLHKLRIFCKATLLALIHLNPLYFFIALFSLEISMIIVDFFIRHQEKQSPKLELTQHLLINVALGMILCVPDALLGLVVVSLLVAAVIVLDFVINWHEYGEMGVREDKVVSLHDFDYRDKTEGEMFVNINKESEMSVSKENGLMLFE